MAHKTLTISEEAYEALHNLKNPHESFTDVILRLSKQKEIGKLSEYIRKATPDHELANNVASVSKRFRKTKLRNVRL